MIPLAAFVLLAVQGEAKILQRPPRYNDPPSQYEQLVAQYQRGEYDSAVARVARTPAEAFEKPLENALARLWYIRADGEAREDAKCHAEGLA